MSQRTTHMYPNGITRSPIMTCMHLTWPKISAATVSCKLVDPLRANPRRSGTVLFHLVQGKDDQKGSRECFVPPPDQAV